MEKSHLKLMKHENDIYLVLNKSARRLSHSKASHNVLSKIERGI